MNHSDRFDRTVSDWLHVDAEHRVPAHLDAVLRRTRTERQRPAWSSLERWLPMQTTLRFTPVPRVAWLLVIAALVVAFGAAVLVVTSQPRRPAPFGIARNGPIVHDAADGDIHVFDPVTGDTKVIVNGPEHDVAPNFSHDGSRIVFAREAGPGKYVVFVVNADGTEMRALSEPIFHLNWYAWSPDDRRLAIVSDTGPAPSIRILSIDGATDDTLDLATAGHQVGLPRDFGDVWVQWRPNGRELVFKGMTVGPGRTMYGLYMIGVDGSGLHPILPISDFIERWQAPALSPDGTKIAWGLWDAFGVGRIHVVDVDTGGVRMPIFDGISSGDWGPAWSPDGERLVLNRLVGGGQEGLVVAAAGGGPVVEIGPRFPAYSGGADGQFSPDGTMIIAIYGEEPAAGEVHLLDPAGGSDRSLPIVTDLGGTMQRLAP
jgi:Tol biopolymer transport system component